MKPNDGWQAYLWLQNSCLEDDGCLFNHDWLNNKMIDIS